MKYIDIQKRYSDIVLEHMQNGWMLVPNNTSWGRVESVTFLRKNDEMLAVFTVIERKFKGGSTVSIKQSITKPYSFNDIRLGWDEGAETVAEFYTANDSYDLDDAWFFESKEEADLAVAVRNERCERSYIHHQRELKGEVSAELMNLIRQHKGWKTVAKKNIRVFKETSWCGERRYRVSCLDNMGFEKKSFIVRF